MLGDQPYPTPRELKEENRALYEMYATASKVVRNQLWTRFGKRCKRCGCTDERVLTIDHVQNDGNARRRQGENTFRAMCQAVYWGDDGVHFQILCRNCNWAKHIEHQKSLKNST